MGRSISTCTCLTASLRAAHCSSGVASLGSSTATVTDQTNVPVSFMVSIYQGFGGASRVILSYLSSASANSITLLTKASTSLSFLLGCIIANKTFSWTRLDSLAKRVSYACLYAEAASEGCTLFVINGVKREKIVICQKKRLLGPFIVEKRLRQQIGSFIHFH